MEEWGKGDRERTRVRRDGTRKRETGARVARWARARWGWGGYG